MFYLAPHPKLDRPLRGSPRMFTVGWVEKYFSRVRPWHVVVIWMPCVAWCLSRAVRDPQAPALAIAGMFAMGMLGWTLLEYGLHRFVFHHHPDENSELQKDAMWLIHGIHHDYPWDGDRLVMPPTVTALVLLALWFPLKALLGVHLHYSFTAGLVFGYVAYDLTHYWLHHAVPKSAAGKWLRRYHLVHHFSTPEVRYGITTPLWDLVFGTYPKDKYAALEEKKVAEMEARAHG
jgi:dihydroceramide fatty acyl 2-hydroxylase